MCSQKTTNKDRPEDKNVWTWSTVMTLDCISNDKTIKSKVIYQCLTCDPKTFRYSVWKSKLPQQHVVSQQQFKNKLKDLCSSSYAPENVEIQLSDGRYINDTLTINENHERPRCYINNVSQGLLLRLFGNDPERHADVRERNMTLELVK